MSKKLTTDIFIQKSILIHGNRYDYSLVNYFNSKIEVIIICKIHGNFLQKPYNHLNKCGCQKCDFTLPLTNEQFIEKSNIKHDNKYDYSISNYIRNNIKVNIICNIHGSFEQMPESHLRGSGCPNCCNNKKLTNEQFIEKSKIIHGNKYDYSKVNYVNKHKEVIIICDIHGEFNQKAKYHLLGNGCIYCNESKLEKYLRIKLDNLNIRYEKNKKFEDCKNKLCLPFDFYLIDKNILIECDGKQHYESIEFFGGDNRLKYQKSNDEIKNMYCYNSNIKLIRLISKKQIDELNF